MKVIHLPIIGFVQRNFPCWSQTIFLHTVGIVKNSLNIKVVSLIFLIFHLHPSKIVCKILEKTIIVTYLSIERCFYCRYFSYNNSHFKQKEFHKKILRPWFCAKKCSLPKATIVLFRNPQVFTPLIATIKSPSLTPPLSAGESGTILWTYGR